MLSQDTKGTGVFVHWFVKCECVGVVFASRAVSIELSEVGCSAPALRVPRSVILVVSPLARVPGSSSGRSGTSWRATVSSAGQSLLILVPWSSFSTIESAFSFSLSPGLVKVCHVSIKGSEVVPTFKS